MNSNEIRRILRRHISKDHHIGVFPRDRLQYPRKQYAAFVWNTDPHTERGQHWVAVYIDSDGIGYYFDSYGQYPQYKQYINFLKKHCKRWVYNDVCVQPPYSKACGQFCIYFLIHMSKGWTMQQVTDRVNQSVAVKFVLDKM